MTNTETPPKKRRGCGCGVFTAGCVAGFLALPAFLCILALIAWQFSGVKQAAYIGMLNIAPRESTRLRAAEKLAQFPDDKTKIALVIFVNRVKYEKDKAVAARALATLYALSGQNFGTAYVGGEDTALLESFSSKEWKTIKSNVLRWAFQTLRKEGQPFPVPMPEMPTQNPGQINSAPQTQTSPAASAENAKIAAVMQQISSSEPATGAAAWTALFAMYPNANDYLSAVRPYLDDKTPVSFSIVEEIRPLTNGGQGRIFTAKDTPPAQSGDAALARTVGEALRFHVWQYEHAYEANYSGDFYEWWKHYAQERGLPADRHFKTGMPEED